MQILTISVNREQNLHKQFSVTITGVPAETHTVYPNDVPRIVLSCYEYHVKISKPTSCYVTVKITIEKEIKSILFKLLIYISILQCTSHQPILVANLG